MAAHPAGRVVRRKVQFTMNVLVAFREEGSWWYASCSDLDVHTQGQSRDEAEANLVDALQLFVFSCFERGQLDQVLKDAGFVADRDRGRVEDDKDQAWLEVPLDLVAQHEQDRAHRLGSAG